MQRPINGYHLDHEGDWESLHQRAAVVHGISGDLRLDAFAGRLRTYKGDNADIEAFVSLAVGKPATSLTDHDLDQAMIQLAKWSFEFRRVEALASVQGRSSSRQAFAVVIGGHETRSATFDLSETDSVAVEAMSKRLMERFATAGMKPDIFLAALVDAGIKLLERREEPKHHD